MTSTRERPGGAREDTGLEALGEVRVAEGSSAYWSRPLPANRFAGLTQDMHQAIVLAHAGSADADDALLETVIGEAVETFLGRAGHPVAAALKMGTLMRRIGAREAAIGRSFDVLDHSLRIARSATEAYLPRLLATHPLSEQRITELRADLAIFLDQLREHARVGFDRQWSMEEMTPEYAALALRRMLFDEKSTPEPDRLELLASHAGVALPDRVQAIVVLDGPLPRDLTHHADVLVGLSPNEAFLAGAGHSPRVAQITDQLAGKAILIVGEPVGLPEAPRSIAVARRAAGLLSAGLLARPDTVLRCHDVLGQIATLADPYLLDLMVAKHLQGLEAMSPQRRVDVGALLLEWLETGEPINEIARRNDRHTQTLHGRMRALRHVLGESLTNPGHRVELILALRRELPRWQRELVGGARRVH